MAGNKPPPPPPTPGQWPPAGQWPPSGPWPPQQQWPLPGPPSGPWPPPGPPVAPPAGQPPVQPPPWPQPIPPGPPPPATKTSPLAIAAFLCAALGWWFFGLGSLAGIALGIVSLDQIRHSNGWLRGRGLAIAGIVLGAAFCLLFAFAIIVSRLLAIPHP